MTTCPSVVQGFHVVGLRFREESTGVHQLLWKNHTIRTHSDCKPVDRTLFIVNVPPYCTQDAFTKLFSEYGAVKSVFFHKRPTSGPPPEAPYPHFSCVPPILGFKVAYVVFSQPQTLKKVLALPADTVLTLATDERPVLTGVKKWQHEYNKEFIDQVALGKEVAQVMEDYDKKKEKERMAAQQEPDSEGWVTVNTAKRKKPQLEKVDDLKKRKKNKRKKKSHELVNFYSFQQRQAKMDHLAQLRKKFEEDKKRISQMRASRKFRPY